MTRVGPLVSVVVPVHNEMTTLQGTLRTILAQEYEAFEVVVVDDGSTDASVPVARAVADRHERVRVLENGTCRIRTSASASTADLWVSTTAAVSAPSPPLTTSTSSGVTDPSRSPTSNRSRSAGRP
jgi:cellulose synthase/poly-beta-1,6-N-acetylglucosamine synthase-like glycosyltransferase